MENYGQNLTQDQYLDVMLEKAKQILKLDFEVQKEKARAKIAFDSLKNDRADLEVKLWEFDKA